MTLAEQLQIIGIGKNEAVVYLACLALGEVTIGAIEQKTGLHRQLIYQAAEKLEQENLLTVGEIRGRKYFRAADPSALERRVEERLEAVRGLLPSLYKIVSAPKEEELIRTYSGLDAIRRFYQQSMRTEPKQSIVRVLGSQGQKFSELFDFSSRVFQKFEETRISNKVSLQLLFFIESNKGEFAGTKDRKKTEVKIIQALGSSPLDTVIWNNHVSLLLYGDAPHLIDIFGQATDAFRLNFDVLWNQATPLERDVS